MIWLDFFDLMAYQTLKLIWWQILSIQMILSEFIGKITLVYKNRFLVWGKNGDRCFLLIWVCWIQIYK